VILQAEAAIWALSIVWELLSSPITSPIGCVRWGTKVTARWVDCSMSSFLKPTISEAWIAAPRAERFSGLNAVMSAAGAFTGTESAEGGNAEGD